MKHFFHGKLALQQRVLPIYRVPFFDLLASACKDGMSLFTGLPRPVEGIAVAKKLQVANYRLGYNIHLLDGNFYLCYQRGLMRWLLEQSPDALIVEANPRYLSTPSAVSWMHTRNKPVIGWGLGSPPPHSAPFSKKMGGKRRGGGPPASSQATLFPETIRRTDRLQPTWRRRVCQSWVSTGEDICGA